MTSRPRVIPITVSRFNMCFVFARKPETEWHSSVFICQQLYVNTALGRIVTAVISLPMFYSFGDLSIVHELTYVRRGRSSPVLCLCPYNSVIVTTSLRHIFCVRGVGRIPRKSGAHALDVRHASLIGEIIICLETITARVTRIVCATASQYYTLPVSVVTQ